MVTDVIGVGTITWISFCGGACTCTVVLQFELPPGPSTRRDTGVSPKTPAVTVREFVLWYTQFVVFVRAVSPNVEAFAFWLVQKNVTNSPSVYAVLLVVRVHVGGGEGMYGGIIFSVIELLLGRMPLSIASLST